MSNNVSPRVGAIAALIFVIGGWASRRGFTIVGASNSYELQASVALGSAVDT